MYPSQSWRHDGPKLLKVSCLLRNSFIPLKELEVLSAFQYVLKLYLSQHTTVAPAYVTPRSARHSKHARTVRFWYGSLLVEWALRGRILLNWSSLCWTTLSSRPSSHLEGRARAGRDKTIGLRRPARPLAPHVKTLYATYDAGKTASQSCGVCGWPTACCIPGRISSEGGDEPTLACAGNL